MLETWRGVRSAAARGMFGLAHDAPEPDMRGRGILRLALPRRGPVAQAIVRRAEMRAALHDPVCRAVVGLLGLAAGWFFARRLRQRIGARRPLPDIADHVVEPKTVGGKCADRRSALETILGE